MLKEFNAQLDRLRRAEGNPEAAALIALDFLLEVQPDADDLRGAIEAVAVPHWFDVDTLARLLEVDERNALRIWERLDGLPMVEEFAGRASQKRNVHEVTRLAVRQRLNDIDPARLMKLSERAIMALGDNPEPAVATERLFHRFVAEPEAAAEECEEVIRELVNGGQPKVRENLRGALEELEKTRMVHGRARAEVLLAICWIYFVREELNRVADLVETVEGLAATLNAPSVTAQVFCLRGDLNIARGNLSAAAKSFMQASETAATLASLEPESDFRLFDLGVIEGRIGRVLANQGKLKDALMAFRRSLGIARRLVAKGSLYASSQRTIAVAQAHIGDILLLQNRFEDAYTSIHEAFEIAERLVNENPTNTDFQRDFGGMYLKIADFHLAQGHFEAAFAAIEHSRRIAEYLAAEDPIGTHWQSNLYGVFSRLGSVYLAQNKPDEALIALLQTAKYAREMVRVDPLNTTRQQTLAAACDRIGDVYLAQKQIQKALAAFEESRMITLRLADVDPTNASWQRNLAVSRGKIADAQLCNAPSDETLHEIRASIEILERLVLFDSSDRRLQHDLSVGYSLLARFREARKQYGAAYSFRQKGLKIDRAIAAAEPADGQAQQQLAIDLINLAHLEGMRRSFRQAVAYSREAVQILSTLVETHPDAIAWKRDLETANRQLRNLMEAMRKP